MAKHKYLFLIFFLITISLILSACKPKPQISQQPPATKSQQIAKEREVDYKASFAIFTNNVFRVFTASMYHSQSAEVFITSQNPNILNIKKSPTTWGDFFNSLPMKLSYDCLLTGTLDNLCNTEVKSLKFYINGQRVDDFLEREIKSRDQALISYGAQNETQIQSQLNQIPAVDLK